MDRSRRGHGKHHFWAAIAIAAGLGAAGCGGAKPPAAGTGGAGSGTSSVAGWSGGAGIGGHSAGAGGVGGTSPIAGGEAGQAASSCPSPAACDVGARSCDGAGAPTLCILGPDACPAWASAPACGPHQACAQSGCSCLDDPRCGTPAAEGDFCPAPGGTTFAHCAADAQGCFFVSGSDNACVGDQACVAPGIVATGGACGCPADGGSLGRGCAATGVGSTAPDPGNAAVLQCAASGQCLVWKVLVDCGSQGLTAGTIQGANLCVCKAPAPDTLYVDPSPASGSSMSGPMSGAMSGPPTGAANPAGCRLPSIKVAMAEAGALGSAIARVIVLHDNADAKNPVHLGAASGEIFPLIIPRGVSLISGDPAHPDPSAYVIDVSGVAYSSQPAIALGAGASLAGFTVDASGAPGGPAAAANVQNVVSCAQASQAQTATIDHVVVKARAGETGILVGGACGFSATASTIDGAAVAVDVVRTATGASDTASLTASGLTVTSPEAGSIGFRVGTGLDAGQRSTLAVDATSIQVAGSGIVVAGGSANITNTAVTFQDARVAPENRGLVVSGGSATFAGLNITMGDPGAGGDVIGASSSGGTAEVSDSVIQGAGHFTGVQIVGGADVTISGSAPGATRILTSLAAGSPDPANGIVVVPGAVTANLTLHGGVEVRGFAGGVALSDGSFVSDGVGVSIAGNRGDGVALLGQTMGPTVSLTGMTVRDNGGKGLAIRTIVPSSFANGVVSGNAGDGIDVQRTQPVTLLDVPQFVLSNSTISGNAGRGVALTGQGSGAGALAGGKVGARLTGNSITTNGDVGVFVTEGTDGADGDDTTEAWFDDNDVAGNLTGSAGSSVLAGGFFFASADATTRVRLREFASNRVHGNGRAEIGFNLSQADGTPWNLSASADDPAGLCEDAARSNFVYCYNNFPGDYAIAVAGAGIHVDVRGMHFQDAPAVAGQDYSPTIPGSEIHSFCAPQSCP